MIKLPQLEFHIKLLDKQRTWVTPSSELPSQEAQGLYLQDKMMHLRSEHDKKSCLEDLNHQTLTTEVNLVVIHISFSALHKFFLLHIFLSTLA
jgi:hypothetical protein